MGAPGSGLSGRPPRAVVRAAVRVALSDLLPGERVLVALSGGPDSLALLAATLRVASDSGLTCSAVVVDHGLQPESGQVAAQAVEQARILGCSDASLVGVQVAEGPGSGGPEGAARAARYRALDAAATPPGRPPAAAILLGHTRDDQAETVLLGLARGSGLRSIAGMAPRSGRYRRPLLDVPRSVVHAAADEQARADPRLTPWIDPHNDDARFKRARLRTTGLPALAQALGPGLGAGLARTAALARRDADALDGWADSVWEALRSTGAVEVAEGVLDATASGQRAALVVGALIRQTEGTASVGPAPGNDDHAPASVGVPAAISERIVRRLALAAGCPAGALTSDHVHAVAALLAGSGRDRTTIALPGGLQARREGAYLRVRV